MLLMKRISLVIFLKKIMLVLLVRKIMLVILVQKTKILIGRKLFLVVQNIGEERKIPVK